MKKLIEGSRKVLFAAGVIVLVLIGGYIALLPGNLLYSWLNPQVEADPALVAEFNTPEFKAEAEWLYDADERLVDLSFTVETMGFEREALATKYDGVPLSEWSLADKQQMKQWQKIMDRSHDEYSALARQYNARMKALMEMVPDGIHLGDLNYLLIGLPTHYTALEIWSEQ